MGTNFLIYPPSEWRCWIVSPNVWINWIPIKYLSIHKFIPVIGDLLF